MKAKRKNQRKTRPRKDWKQGREQVIFFMFGGAPRYGHVRPENKERIETILHNSQRAWRLPKIPRTVMHDLERLCTKAKTTPLETITEQIRQYFLQHAEIDLVSWKEPKGLV